MSKKSTKIIIYIVLMFCFCNKVQGLTYGGCEYDKIARLKSLVSNVNLSYDYYLKNDVVYFNVTITNLVPEFYFIDSKTGIKYEYANSTDGEIVISDYQNLSGNYSFYSSLSQCYGIKLGKKYYKFPNYNYYYETPICKENPNFSLCQKWIKVTQTYSELEKTINKYNEENINIEETEKNDIQYKQTYIYFIAKIYVKYYYYILIGIIIICVAIMFISKKKNSFDL